MLVPSDFGKHDVSPQALRSSVLKTRTKLRQLATERPTLRANLGQGEQSVISLVHFASGVNPPQTE